MKIEELKKIIIGKWKSDNEGILNFSTSEDFTFTDKDGKTHQESQKLFLSQEKDGTIKLTCPFLFEPLGLVKSYSEHQITYDSLDLDGKRTEMQFNRIS